VQQVEQEARQVLGVAAPTYQRTTQDSTQSVPREGAITFVPSMPGVRFNPASRTFAWIETVHREDFRFQASPELEGKTARGRVSVYVGSILVSDVAFAIQVTSQPVPVPEHAPLQHSSARPYRRIFASYSHHDETVVLEFERYVTALGDRYLRDVRDLRAGEAWSDRLRQLIDDSDVFQLFWSHNSMRSPFVRQEWEHALSLRRANFVRPTYWEEPLPESPEEALPPPQLRELHFERIRVGWVAGVKAASQTPPTPRSASGPTLAARSSDAAMVADSRDTAMMASAPRMSPRRPASSRAHTPPLPPDVYDMPDFIRRQMDPPAAPIEPGGARLAQRAPEPPPMVGDFAARHELPDAPRVPGSAPWSSVPRRRNWLFPLIVLGALLFVLARSCG
jgi:hypothetical protein